jgi:hypothetical protein
VKIVLKIMFSFEMLPLIMNPAQIPQQYTPCQEEISIGVSIPAESSQFGHFISVDLI